MSSARARVARSRLFEPTSLLIVAALSAACGSASEAPPYEPISCVGTSSPFIIRLYDGVVLPELPITDPPIQYIGVFGDRWDERISGPEALRDYAAAGADGPDFQLLLEAGKPSCAADPAPCSEVIATLDDLPSGSCDSRGTRCGVQFVVGSATGYRRIASRAELLSLFGQRVDTLAKAMLLIAFDGRALACATRDGEIVGTSSFGVAGTRTFMDHEGVHVRSEWHDLALHTAPKHRESYLVTADGEIKNLVQETVAD